MICVDILFNTGIRWQPLNLDDKSTFAGQGSKFVHDLSLVLYYLLQPHIQIAYSLHVLIILGYAQF